VCVCVYIFTCVRERKAYYNNKIKNKIDRSILDVVLPVW
jgi:hypothetical protein